MPCRGKSMTSKQPFLFRSHRKAKAIYYIPQGTQPRLIVREGVTHGFSKCSRKVEIIWFHPEGAFPSLGFNPDVTADFLPIFRVWCHFWASFYSNDTKTPPVLKPCLHFHVREQGGRCLAYVLWPKVSTETQQSCWRLSSNRKLESLKPELVGSSWKAHRWGTDKL